MPCLCWNKMKKTLYFFLSCMGFFTLVSAQQIGQFDDEVAGLVKKYDSLKQQGENTRPTVVFVGSSSVRMWENIEGLSEEHFIINTGFGGSTAEDLLLYTQPLILDHYPDQVFIYEGDNDVFMHHSLGKIMRRMRKITSRIWDQNPECKLVIISAKPSIARWEFKKKYLRLNKRFSRWARRKDRMTYADVWTPMTPNGQLNQSLFIEDNLHMNSEGYRLWTQVIQPLLLK